MSEKSYSENTVVALLSSLQRSSEVEHGDAAGLVEKAFLSVFEAFGLHRMSVWLLNEQGTTLTCFAEFEEGNFTLGDGSKYLCRKSYPIYFSAIDNNAEIVAEDASTHPLITEFLHSYIIPNDIVGLLDQPLRHDGKTIGVFWNETTKKGLQWTDSHKVVCFGLADLFSRVFSVNQFLQIERKLRQKNELLSSVERLAEVGGWEYDIANDAMTWTDETCRIHGYEPGCEIDMATAVSHFTNESRQIIENLVNLAITQKETYDVEVELQDTSGELKWVRTSGRVREVNGQVTGVYGAIRDVTQDLALLKSEQQAGDYLYSIFVNITDGIVTINRDGLIESINPSVSQLFGYHERELIGQNVRILMPEPYSSEHDGYLLRHLNTGHKGIIGKGRELPARRKDGTEFPIELTVSEVASGEAQFFIGIVKDISQRKRSEQQMHHLAYCNELTGLANRYSLERALSELITQADAQQQTITGLYIDLDHFSRINLAHGKDSGDDVLILIAQRLDSLLDSHLDLFHVGADNFVILHKSLVSEQANEHVERINLLDKVRAAIAQPIGINGSEHQLVVSMGLVQSKALGLEPQNFIQHLESARNAAKAKGGGSAVIFDDDDAKRLARIHTIETELSEATKSEGLELALQPQYTCDKQVHGAEVLLRWTSPSLGFVSPAEFIPIAETSGAILDIGNWVLEQSCKLLHGVNENITVSVNISAHQFAAPTFVEHAKATIQRYKIKPCQLMFELTETSLASDLALVKQRMHDLTDFGIRFSIDDFGTGYSNLSYLESLPIHELKIDRAFIDTIREEKAEVALVNTILQMGKSLGLKVVAEGVETAYQLEYLKQRECDFLQGYHLSRPIPAKEWLALVKD